MKSTSNYAYKLYNLIRASLRAECIEMKAMWLRKFHELLDQAIKQGPTKH